MDFEEYPTRI